MAPLSLHLPMAADMHVHLRQDAMCDWVTHNLVNTGIDTYLVMPNLIPPITTTDMAITYRNKLQSIAPSINFLMTLYLTPELTVDEIYKAKQAGITGIKSYPRGVTTNSDSGIESYDKYDDIFMAMQENNLILHLHGECPCNEQLDITIFNAEQKFLQQLITLHKKFPNLRIILEHATTVNAINVIKSLGNTVACTITIHHLYLTINDWAGKPHNYCKPVAKTYVDRNALRDIIRQQHPRFFLGTDSAPHPRHNKESSNIPAGVFTSFSPLLYLTQLFHSLNMLDCLEGFACTYGRLFYQLPIPTKRCVTLTHVPQQQYDDHHPDKTRVKGTEIPSTLIVNGMITSDNKSVEIVPFLAGEYIPWVLSIVNE